MTPLKRLTYCSTCDALIDATKFGEVFGQALTKLKEQS